MTGKIIPEEYAGLVQEVLRAYPELERTRIEVKKKKNHPVPYGTTPTPWSFFKKPSARVYHITLLEEAEPPVEAVLFKNLTDDMRKGVLAHELFHVLQFQSRSRLQLLRLLVSYPFHRFLRRLERAADKGAIDRGYGRELYAHAVYIRSVPGYVEERPAVDTLYMLPEEIAGYIGNRKL